MEIGEAAVRGIFLPVFALVDSVITYAINQIFVSLGNITVANGKTASGLPGVALDSIAVTIMLLFMALTGYFEDAGEAWKFPLQAMAYSVCGVAGLFLFYAAISNVSLGGIGSDALVSTVASIVISIVVAVISVLRGI